MPVRQLSLYRNVSETTFHIGRIRKGNFLKNVLYRGNFDKENFICGKVMLGKKTILYVENFGKATLL